MNSFPVLIFTPKFVFFLEYECPYYNVIMKGSFNRYCDLNYEYCEPCDSKTLSYKKYPFLLNFDNNLALLNLNSESKAIKKISKFMLEGGRVERVGFDNE
jgi:hypothetical protein